MKRGTAEFCSEIQKNDFWVKTPLILSHHFRHPNYKTRPPGKSRGAKLLEFCILDATCAPRGRIYFAPPALCGAREINAKRRIDRGKTPRSSARFKSAQSRKTRREGYQLGCQRSVQHRARMIIEILAQKASTFIGHRGLGAKGKGFTQRRSDAEIESAGGRT